MQDQTQQIPPEVKTYLEGILQDANMVTLDDEMKEEMIKELYVRLDNFITAAIVDNMPADKVEEFIKMNEEKKSKEEIEKFVKEVMPNAQEVFTNAFMEFRDLYLGNVAAHRNAPEEAETTQQSDTNTQAN